jgi:hypothetical protein
MISGFGQLTIAAWAGTFVCWLVAYLIFRQLSALRTARIAEIPDVQVWSYRPLNIITYYAYFVGVWALPCGIIFLVLATFLGNWLQSLFSFSAFTLALSVGGLPLLSGRYPILGLAPSRGLVLRPFRSPRRFHWHEVEEIGVSDLGNAWFLFNCNDILKLGRNFSKEERRVIEANYPRPIRDNKKPEWVLRLRERGMLQK